MPEREDHLHYPLPGSIFVKELKTKIASHLQQSKNLSQRVAQRDAATFTRNLSLYQSHTGKNIYYFNPDEVEQVLNLEYNENLGTFKNPEDLHLVQELIEQIKKEREI